MTEYLYEKTDRGIRINACRSYSDSAVVPEEIQGIPVTELAPYAFSGDRRTIPGGMWTGNAPEGEEPPFLEGERLKNLVLPATVKKAGAYAFYNCRNWESLTCYSSFQDIGAGAFTGCRKLSRLDMTMLPEEKRPGLREILAELPQEVHVTYRGEQLTKLVFPAYYEDAVENTPARIVSVQVHGSGHFYRYCFDGRELQFKDYDAQFPNLVNMDREELAVEAAVGRLRYPFRLSEEAENGYREFLDSHRKGAAEWFLKQQDLGGLKWLLGVVDFSDDDLKQAIEAAGRLRAAEGLAALMEWKQKKYAPSRKRFEL